METIFIQIASYKDPQLVPTIQDCIKRAKHPERLVFCVAWQHDSTETKEIFDEIESEAKLKILDIPHDKSKGTCWARNAIQQQYKGEDYTLQLDSHHRFVENWDEECIKMVKDLQSDGYEKPLLTAYIPSFDPDDDPGKRVQEPWWMTFDRFIPEGAVFFLPATMPDWQTRNRPMRARFYSAHFGFTLGKFCEECQHDPEFYFHGEEISIAVRAFTHGYDLFHPHKVIAWHEYTRKGRTKHWDDHDDWGQMNSSAHHRNRSLFGMDGQEQADLGKYGFGTARSVRDYERYAGVCFKKRGIQQWTQDNKEAPSPDKYESEEDFEASCLPIFKHCIDINFKDVPEKDYDFWVVAFKDENGEEIYRQDANKDEVATILADPDGYGKVWRSFYTEKKPKSWIVWPHSESKDWCEQITGIF